MAHTPDTPSARVPADPASADARHANVQAMNKRVAAFVAHYDRVHRERMADLPITNPRLQVEGVGFDWAFVPTDTEMSAEAAAAATEEAPMIEGILITPWFMNLVRLPLAIEPARQRVGRKSVHRWGQDSYEFIGGHDDAVGYHEMCSLFSPMNGFDQQALARETAQHVLQLARPAPTVAPAMPAQSAKARRPQEPVPARRAFFMPRSNSANREGA